MRRTTALGGAPDVPVWSTVRATLMRLVLASSVLAGASTAAHAAGPTAPTTAVPPLVTGHVRPLPEYVREGLNPGQATLVRQLDGLAASGVPLSSLQPRYERRPGPAVRTRGVLCSSFLFSFFLDIPASLVVAGDLDGDHDPDVVESRAVSGAKGRATWVVTARDGRTGTVLWVRHVPLAAGHYGVAVPSSVGPAGRPGVVLLDLGFAYRRSGGTEITDSSIDASGLDGSGRRVWTHVESGRWTDTPSGSVLTHFPTVLELGQLRHGAKDLVVVRDDVSGDSASATAERVSGVDGSARAITQPVVQPQGAGAGAGAGLPLLPALGLVPDQNRDGLEDLYSATVGSGSALTVHRGDTGAVIWANTTIPLREDVSLEDAGGLTSATGLHDLVLTTDQVVTTATGTPVGLVGTEAWRSISLLAGGTGSAVWTKPGGAPYLVGRAGASAQGAVGILSYQEVLAAGTERLEVSLAAYDGNGLPVWHATFDFQHAADDCGAAGATPLMGLGDLDGDGTQEGWVDMVIFDGSQFEETVRTVSGRDGSELDRSWDWGLGGSLDGHGDERAVVSVSGSRVSLTAVRGVGRAPLWTRMWALPGAAVPWAFEASAVPITSTRCLDVAVVADGSRGSIATVLSSSGRPRWTVTYGNEDGTSGRLTRGTTGRGYC